MDKEAIVVVAIMVKGDFGMVVWRYKGKEAEADSAASGIGGLALEMVET